MTYDKIPSMHKFSKRLKELRIENGYTQKDVADKLGVNSVIYLRYEKAQRQPSFELLATIALIYDVSVDYLLGLVEFR